MKNLVGCIGYGIRSLNLGQYEQHQAMHKTVWNARASLLALSITDRIVCGASHSEMERRARNRAGMAGTAKPAGLYVAQATARWSAERGIELAW